MRYEHNTVTSTTLGILNKLPFLVCIGRLTVKIDSGNFSILYIQGEDPFTVEERAGQGERRKEMWRDLFAT